MQTFVLKVTRTVQQEATIAVNAEDETAAIAAAEETVKHGKFVAWHDCEEIAKSNPQVQPEQIGDLVEITPADMARIRNA